LTETSSPISPARERTSPRDSPAAVFAWLFTSFFGVAAPVVCFGFATLLGIFGRWTVPLDLFAGIAVATSVAWLVARERWSAFQAVACGVFSAGALFAVPFALYFGSFGVSFLFASLANLELAMAPWALLGIAPILGLAVYARNARTAWRATCARDRRRFLPLVSALLSAALPGGVAVVIGRAAEGLETAILDSTRPLEGLELERWRWLARGDEWDRLRSTYFAITQSDSMAPAPLSERERRIADAYFRLTGRTLYWSD
jgi:hypothetical protein